MILIPPLSRQLLHFMVKFSCSLCQQTEAKARNSWARHLSQSFSHLISQKEWASQFFELLLHSNGLHAESQSTERREIWSIDEKYKKEIQQRLLILKTPRKKSNMTPRKTSRIGRCLTGLGKSLKRNLFNNTVIESIACMIRLISSGILGYQGREGIHTKRNPIGGS